MSVPVVAATGTAAAYGGGHGAGMMGGGWGLFGAGMGLWGLLWMALLLGVPLYAVYTILDRDSSGSEERSLSVLRERYARGELSDEEFERRRQELESSNR
nr:SHOCT domain-containing protein [Halolamina sediminis]